MSNLKIGIIGCGNMAQWAHLPAFSAVKEVELKSLYDPRREVASKICKKWNISEYYQNLDELLTSDIEAVCILTPVQCHKFQIIKSLEAGKHVFTEKPLAMSAKSAEEIEKAAEKSGKLVMVGYMKQHEKSVAEALRVVSENNFGKILFVRTHSFIGSGWNASVDRLDKIISSDEPLPPLNLDEMDPAPEWLEASRDKTFYSFDNPFYALLDTGCHSINFLRYVTGKDYKLESVSNRSGARIINFDFGEFTGISEFCVNFAMRKWDEITEIYLEKATVKIKTPPPTSKQSGAEVEIYSENGIIQQNRILEDNNQWAFMNQAEAFAEAVKNGETSTKYVEESIKDIDMMEQIYKMENSGEQK